MKLTLVETKTIEDRKLERYEIADYEVKVVYRKDGDISISVREKRDDYLPTIYCRDGYGTGIQGFEIQTTSYGALSPEETRKMVDALNQAVEVAEILTKTFVKKEEK